MFNEKNPMIMKYVPDSKKAAINSAWEDSDGYWITLNDEWNADRMDWNCRTIHEDTIKDLRYQISGIRRLSRKEMEDKGRI